MSVLRTSTVRGCLYKFAVLYETCSSNLNIYIYVDISNYIALDITVVFGCMHSAREIQHFCDWHEMFV